MVLPALSHFLMLPYSSAILSIAQVNIRFSYKARKSLIQALGYVIATIRAQESRTRAGARNFDVKDPIPFADSSTLGIILARFLILP